MFFVPYIQCSSPSLSLFLLYPPIDSNNIAIGIKMVDVFEGIDTESNQSNPAETNLRQEQAEKSTNNPSQSTCTVIQPGLDLRRKRGKGIHWHNNLSDNVYYIQWICSEAQLLRWPRTFLLSTPTHGRHNHRAASGEGYHPHSTTLDQEKSPGDHSRMHI